MKSGEEMDYSPIATGIFRLCNVKVNLGKDIQWKTHTLQCVDEYQLFSHFQFGFLH